jgi:hypothetical protein
MEASAEMNRQETVKLTLLMCLLSEVVVTMSTLKSAKKYY